VQASQAHPALSSAATDLLRVMLKVEVRPFSSQPISISQTADISGQKTARLEDNVAEFRSSLSRLVANLQGLLVISEACPSTLQLHIDSLSRLLHFSFLPYAYADSTLRPHVTNIQLDYRCYEQPSAYQTAAHLYLHFVCRQTYSRSDGMFGQAEAGRR